MRNPGAGVIGGVRPLVTVGSGAEEEEKDEDGYQQKVGRPGRIENFVPEIERQPSPTPGSDYRVTSINRRRSPGRLADFVPEVERSEPQPSKGAQKFDYRVSNILPSFSSILQIRAGKHKLTIQNNL